MDILVIENSSVQQSLLKQQIRSLGHKVTACANPKTALESCQQMFYPFIILDLESTNMDGMDFCRQIRSLEKRNRSMILVLQEDDRFKDIEAAITGGADDYLIKPVHVEQLKVRLMALEQQLLRFIQLKVKREYLTSVLRTMRKTKQLLVSEKDRHRLLQNICDTFTDTQGILSAEIKLIDTSGILVKVAESSSNRKFAIGLTKSETITTWLEHAGKCYGLMTVVLSSMLVSTEEEQSFLDEVAADIASALFSLEIEKKRRRTERALWESKARYQELGDSITDLFFVLDKDLKCMYWNRASENLTGISMSDALGQSLYKVFPKLEGTEAAKEYLEALQAQKPHSFIQTYQLKGDKPSFFEVSVYPSRDGLSVFAKDVTIRKQMEDALKKSWDYLENLNNSLGDAIFTVKMPEQIIEYGNRAVENIFGYIIDECIGENTRMFFPHKKSYLDFSRRLINAFKQQQEVLRTEQVLKRKNEECFTAEITTTFLHENNKLIRTISIVRDITDRKEMELALKQERASLAQKVEERTAALQRMNAELARASQLKDEFLANMSHELRTPLNAILGYAKILKKTNDLTQLQLEGLDTIRNSGEHLLNLINDILELSKIEAGRLDLHLSEFHLPEFLRQIANMIRIRTEHRDIVFVYENDPNPRLKTAGTSLPVGVYADEKRLREVLINLLDNAVKFTEEGKVVFRVTVCSESRSLRSDVEGRNKERHSVNSVPDYKRLRFEVEDTGIGIASEQLEAIFLPFQQVGKYRYSTEGTGLGLAISRQLVKIMGGELHVASAVGEGSTFWFELDMPEIPGLCPETRFQQPEIIGYRGAQRTIMIVDDQQENRAVLRNMLFPLGFEILEAENGQECLDTAMRSKPDLILLDLLMPGIDGFETARRIRELPEIRDMKIIAISASVFEETQERSLANGCDDFLPKPIEEETLLERLQTHLNLEWVYRDDFGGDTQTDKPSFAPIEVSLPPEEADILRKLAGCGNITRLLEQLEHIETLGEHYLPLVSELRKLAKSFQVQNIVEYLEQLEKHHEG